MKNKLRILRAVHRLTQEELAKELGVTRHTIIAIENERYDPSLSLAYRMAGLFGLLVEDIFIPNTKRSPDHPTDTTGHRTLSGFPEDVQNTRNHQSAGPSHKNV